MRRGGPSTSREAAVTRVQQPPTAGRSTVRYLVGVATLISVAALLFIVVDLRHRVIGYRAANGSGIAGLATLTHCEWHRYGSVCVGDFVSRDNRIHRAGLPING